jgi:4-hydroxybenzoate adenylyltransferase
VTQHPEATGASCAPVSVNCAEVLASRVAEHGWADRTAIISAEGTWTHGQLHDLAARAATVLASHGLSAGDRMLIALPDGFAWFVAFLAAARFGVIAVCVNPGLSAEEHRFQVTNARPKLAVSEPAIAGHFAPVSVVDPDDLLRLAEHAPPRPAVFMRSEDPLYAQYTSGTTGTPAGVVHGHGDIGRYHDCVAVPVIGPRPDDVSFSASKLYFAYGFGNAFAFPLWSGSAVVLLREKPTPARVEALVRQHRVTVFYAVPSLYAALATTGDPAAFRSVRVAVSAGEPLHPTVLAGATALLGSAPLDQLGSTEAGHGFCSNTAGANLPGTIGRPLPGFELELRGLDGRPVPEGVEGELWVRGPTLLLGFLGQPRETAGRMADGWWNTRDRAIRRADGAYVHHGRTDDLEMVGGITVAPWETEQVFGTHPDVAAVVATTMLDEHGATKLWAYVVPRPGIEPTDELAAELLSQARGSLAPYKVPRGIRFVEDLPRTATGKTRRFLVRQGKW